MRCLPILSCFAFTALSACAMGPARPDQVDLTRDLLTVQMTDGSQCLGPAPVEGAAAGWSGTLQSCPWPYAYTVEIDPGTNPVRFVLQEVFGALGGDNIIRPIATVTVTRDDGIQTVFETPDRISAVSGDS